MKILGILGGIGSTEILILLFIILFLVACPILWIQERRRRKYWQSKAEEYEKRLLDKK